MGRDERFAGSRRSKISRPEFSRWRNTAVNFSRGADFAHALAARLVASPAKNYDRQARLAQGDRLASHGSSDYQKQVVEHVLQKPFTTLEAYYDFWARMEDASKNDATFFFCVLAQKMLSADKRAATGADVALGVSGASVLGTMLQLVLYYPVQAEDKEMKALSKKLRQSSGRSTIDSLTVEALFEMVGKGTKRDTLVSFVERASSVDPPSTAGSPDRDPSAFAYGLLFGYLQQCVRQREQVPQILKTLLGILRLGHPLLTPTRALALLHMLTHVIVEFPRWTEEELAETRQAVAPLLLWARPVGGDAQACLALIDAEIRLRAASAWLVLQRDVGWLGVADDVACSHLGLGALADATTVHFALDEQADWGRAFRQLFLDAQPAAPPRPKASAPRSRRCSLRSSTTRARRSTSSRRSSRRSPTPSSSSSPRRRCGWCRRPPTAAGWWRRACRRWRRSSRRRRRSTAARRRSRVTCSAPASPSSSTASSTATRSPQRWCARCARLLSSLGSGATCTTRTWARCTRS